MTTHTESHPLAGKTIDIKPVYDVQTHPRKGDLFVVEDWWDKLTGESWMFASGNFAAMNYGERAGIAALPLDNEVVYGKIDGLGYLLHISELGEEVKKS